MAEVEHKARVARVVRNESKTTEGGATVATVVVDAGGGDNVNADMFGDSGVDAPPLPGDYASIVPAAGRGREHVTGLWDPKALPIAADGEHRIYGRNLAGVPVCQVWLKDNGDIELTVLLAGLTGKVIINENVEIDKDGNVKVDADLEVTGDLVVGGKIDAGGEITANAGTPASVTVSQHVHTAFGTPPTPGT